MEKKIAVVSAILEEPQEVQQRFNEIIAEFRGIVRGRTGIPFDQYDISVVTIIVFATVDEINSFTGKLGNLKHISVKTSISKKTIEE
ncbi:MAG: iron-only hydrogenase system regulator [Clostridiales bacterium 38-18]|nr:MAG: iron-only hydrogenase system regulator [Clostridiales bacterium 38-18]